MNAILEDTEPRIGRLSRRHFLAAAAGGGFALALGWPAVSDAADPPKYGALGMANGVV